MNGRDPRRLGQVPARRLDHVGEEAPEPRQPVGVVPKAQAGEGRAERYAERVMDGVAAGHHLEVAVELEPLPAEELDPRDIEAVMAPRWEG